MTKKLLIAFATVLFVQLNAQAQCSWQNVVTDGFEYTTVCPNLVPGATIHNTPQSFAVYTGATSLYLNFTNCVGGTGTCAGDMVYERGFSVCRNQDLRFSAWLTTSFGGTQCNMHIVVKDGNGTILNNQLNVVPAYAPAWTQYNSGTITPITDSVVFVMYTNVGGGGGNDLSFDDFMMDKCVGGGNSTTAVGICGPNGPANLYNYLPGSNNVNNGTWSGPGALGGGYLGTFDPASSTPGMYVYTNPWFGPLPGCPMVYDTMNVTVDPGPTVNLGNDTTMCTNQSWLMSVGSTPGYTYLWQNGVTGPNQLAFTISTVDTFYTYWVRVTAPGGCSNTDTITVYFNVCTGMDEMNSNESVSIFPVPAHDELNILLDKPVSTPMQYSIFSPIGASVSNGYIKNQEEKIMLPVLAPGLYNLVIDVPGQQPISKKIVIRN